MHGERGSSHELRSLGKKALSILSDGERLGTKKSTEGDRERAQEGRK